MMSEQSYAQFWNTARTVALVLVILASVCGSVVLAEKYFDKEDEKALGNLSGALMAWYEVNQLGQPQGDADMERVFTLLKKVHIECSKVPDKTLRKLDAKFAIQWRQNLQEGARQYEMGMREYYGAKKDGEEPSSKAKTQMSEGQHKMVQFHKYYNANIERIARDLKSKGVDLFG